MATLGEMSYFLLLLGVGLVCAAIATVEVDESAATDGLDGMMNQPEKVSRYVFVVNKTPLSDPDYTEFVHTMLKAKLETDGSVYVKIAGGELQRIKDTKELDNLLIVGLSGNIFFNIADVLLTDGIHSNVALLTRNMKLVENGVDTVAALVHTTRARVDVFTMEPKSLERGTRTRRQAGVPGYSVYQQIAQATGGVVVNTDKNNIDSVVNLLKQAVKSNSVDILRFNFPGRNAGKHFMIPVDDTMTQLTMQIQTPSARPIIMIIQPSGMPLPPTSGQFLGNSLELFELNMTKTTDYGQWKVLKAGRSDWDVKVTGQSPVDFSYDFMEPGPDGIGMYPLNGRPIAGRTYQLNINVARYDIIKSVNVVMLVDSNNMPAGMPQMLHNVGGRRGKSMFVTNITIPTLDFKVAVDGMDKSNNVLHRLSPTLVSPISINLLVPPMNNVQLYANDTLRIPITIFNEARTQQEVIVRIEDDKAFAQSPVMLSYTLKEGENRTGYFTIKSGPTVALTSTVVITAKPYIRGQVTQGQFAIRRFTVQERTTTTTTSATSTAKQTTTVSSSSPTPTPGQQQMTQTVPTQSTTPACNTGTINNSSNQVPSTCGNKVATNSTGSKPSVRGLHGYLHLLLKHMDTDFEVEIAN